MDYLSVSPKFVTAKMSVSPFFPEKPLPYGNDFYGLVVDADSFFAFVRENQETITGEYIADF
jgi:hypothetical protein